MVFTVLPSAFLHSPSLNISRVTHWWLDHIRYQAANPAKAANQVAHRTCPVGCRRTAMAIWQMYAVPPDAAVTQTWLTNPNTHNSVTCIYSSLEWKDAYPFWPHSMDIYWCHHPLFREQACQHLKHLPGWFYPSLPIPRTPVRKERTELNTYFLFCRLFMSDRSR